MYLFVSPHYDDAVYSCGGTLHQLSRQGVPVMVVTTMGGFPDKVPITPITEGLHQRWQAGENPVRTRRAEDAEALGRLGTKAKHVLEVPDCVYRTNPHTDEPLYPTEDSLWKHIHPDDWAASWLRTRHFTLDEAVLAQSTRMYAPLAAGAHVDHLLVRDVALALLPQLQEWNIELWLYADYPYIEDATALTEAIASLPSDLHITKTYTMLTADDVDAKIDAVKDYRSQISTFWQSESMLEERIQAALTADTNMPTESYYQISQPSQTTN